MNPLTTPRVELERTRSTRQTKPIATVALTTSLQTLYTARTDADFLIRHMWAANITAGAVAITVHLVPAAGTASDANAIAKGFSILPNTTVRLEFLAGGEYGTLLQPGMMLQALAAAGTSINVGGWGEDLTGGVA